MWQLQAKTSQGALPPGLGALWAFAPRMGWPARAKLSKTQCDERKPECDRCRKYGITCDYAVAQSPSNSLILAGFKPDTAVSTMSRACMERRLGQLLGMDEPSCDLLCRMGPDPSRRTNLAVLHHFITYSTETIPNLSLQMIMRTDLIRTAFTVLLLPPPRADQDR